ncbi:MAG: hypothetical protein A2751_04950 [Candidatus Doudnabacteria bacterium RIFCSPHIGHO2_01_FULL_46_14]|uniref:riboflavin kinase n=1 Tax=Candidatus Doudnabacteria bacterium RIFCSPHIGHO2_01_FULL_46_14 TaxID=1817824 RepID=A0A1F5NNP9_9BACT|nr:MAG: hypothetical protein A2751_04950 [Candidatus Doudnabacteria bacterium RIFCSPHIGHO2_01_FULL_46_14]
MFQRKRITGIVEKNFGRGTKLGFPTANMHIVEGDLEEGIYVALTKIHNPFNPPYLKGDENPGAPPLKLRGGEGELLHPSLVFIGAAETFGESEKKLEVYILDFNRDIYGQEITVQLLEKIRDNIKFNSKNELVAQMKRDEHEAHEFFKTYGRIE